MAHAALSHVALASIKPNPFRDLKNYPFNQRKLDALLRSIDDVGLWEGMIGRPVEDGYELAFGHHRWKAAQKKKFETVPLIVRRLTDQQMIEFMGRENLEDFNSDFLVQLNAWHAARQFKFPPDCGKRFQAIDLAILLGWTQMKGSTPQLNQTARACHAALVLIESGCIDRDDLADMTVNTALELVERTQARMEMLDKLGKMGNRPAAEIARDKRHVGGAAKTVAKDIREGKVASKNIRSEIDERAVKSAAAKGKASPLFAGFAKVVADNIHKMLVSDTVAERLEAIEKALPHVTMEEDRAALRRVDFALAEHVETSERWRGRLTRKGQRVVPFKLLKKEENWK